MPTLAGALSVKFSGMAADQQAIGGGRFAMSGDMMILWRASRRAFACGLMRYGEIGDMRSRRRIQPDHECPWYALAGPRYLIMPRSPSATSRLGLQPRFEGDIIVTDCRRRAKSAECMMKPTGLRFVSAFYASVSAPPTAMAKMTAISPIVASLHRHQPPSLPRVDSLSPC